MYCGLHLIGEYLPIFVQRGGSYQCQFKVSRPTRPKMGHFWDMAHVTQTIHCSTAVIDHICGTVSHSVLKAHQCQSQLVLPSENDSRGRAFFLFNITSCSCRTRLRSVSSRRCRSSKILRWSSTNFSCSSACRAGGNNKQTHLFLSLFDLHTS